MINMKMTNLQKEELLTISGGAEVGDGAYLIGRIIGRLIIINAMGLPTLW